MERQADIHLEQKWKHKSKLNKSHVRAAATQRQPKVSPQLMSIALDIVHTDSESCFSSNRRITVLLWACLCSTRTQRDEHENNHSKGQRPKCGGDMSWRQPLIKTHYTQKGRDCKVPQIHVSIIYLYLYYHWPCRNRKWPSTQQKQGTTYVRSRDTKSWKRKRWFGIFFLLPLSNKNVAPSLCIVETPSAIMWRCEAATFPHLYFCPAETHYSTNFF